MQKLSLGSSVALLCGVMTATITGLNVGTQQAIANDSPFSSTIEKAPVNSTKIRVNKNDTFGAALAALGIDLSAVESTASGLGYVDNFVGEGASPQRGDTVTVHYTGRLLNGKFFDSSVVRNQPFSFQIGTGSVIEGWDEGIMSMQPGGKRTLIIPSHLAYGAQGFPGVIPPNSTLVFEVELLSIR